MSYYYQHVISSPRAPRRAAEPPELGRAVAAVAALGGRVARPRVAALGRRVACAADVLDREAGAPQVTEIEALVAQPLGAIVRATVTRLVVKGANPYAPRQ